MTEITPIDFVRLIYGEQFPGFLSLWSKQTRKTRFYSGDEMHLLKADIGELSASEDLYLSLGTQVERLAETKRGGADTVVALPGFVADIDFAAAKSSAKAYPTDLEEAQKILESFPFKPAVVIETGNGLHVHFLLDQLHVIATSQDREQAGRLWTAFQRKLIAHFRKHGRDIDSVGDLSRNYRIATTANHKSDPPKPVRALAIVDDQRINLSAIREFVADVLDPVSLGDATSGERSYPPADHGAIVEGCAWYRNVAVDNATSCDEPNWFAAASITSRCKDGERIFHEFSQKHPKYSQREASQKFKRALEAAGPRTCRSIEFELGHSDCADCPAHGQITSPVQLGHQRGTLYNPGEEGPVPLGYLPDGQFVFFEQTRRILIVETSNRLIGTGALLNLAPAEFWQRNFTNKKGEVNAFKAGTVLMQACRDRGGFDVGRVRGRGVYVDRDKVVRNFGDHIPDSAGYTYICHLPLTMDGDDRHVDPSEVLAFFRLFNFADPSAAYLLLGWMASAVICGALSWRTHVLVMSRGMV